ncbi:hypothetical protein [Phreatobacter sp.]|uniref:hypothetical protein n=1 Tax=Phreatobacter sp. TaxID=1966341 RepID=UPI003F71835E
MAAAIPNLFLKWLAVRELLRLPQSNAEIATRLWGPDDGPSKFSKMLRGDYGCEPDVAGELAEVVNKRIAIVRGAAGRHDPAGYQFRPTDFEAPALDFTRQVITATEVIDPDALERTHKALVRELGPDVPASPGGGPHLAIEQYGTTRFFEGATAAAAGPPVFEIGRHKGLFAIDGLLPEDLDRPLKLYVMFSRDPGPSGQRIWDITFQDAVRWLPSPFDATVEGGRILLMREPKPVQPITGRFRLTAIVVRDPAVLPRLDPRGARATSAPLDEEETARLITNMTRVAKSHANAVAFCSSDYLVRDPKAA